jgi:hypothetical protein
MFIVIRPAMTPTKDKPLSSLRNGLSPVHSKAESEMHLSFSAQPLIPRAPTFSSQLKDVKGTFICTCQTTTMANGWFYYSNTSANHIFYY